MRISFSSASVDAVESDILIVFAPEKTDQALPDHLAGVNQANGGWLDEIYASGEFSGKAYETALLFRPNGLQAKRLLVIGSGPANKFDTLQVSRVTGAAIRAARK